MMNPTLKAMIPVPALNFARLLVDWQSLLRTKKLAFNNDSLKPLADVSPATIWADPAIAADWEKDHAFLSNIMTREHMNGGVNPGDQRALYYLVKALQPKNFLEVGTHIGASTLFIARALAQNGLSRMTSVDIYDVNDPQQANWHYYGASTSPAQTLEKAGCRDIVTFSAEGAMPFMNKTQEKFDFIFLDGDHKAAAVYKEVAAALKILSPGGVILLHDVFPDGKPLYPDNNIIHGPWQAALRIHKEVPGLKILPLGDLPWPTKQGVNATSLALAVRA
jgi:predicted O-methyltransferase YrrM